MSREPMYIYLRNLFTRLGQPSAENAYEGVVDSAENNKTQCHVLINNVIYH